MTSCLRPGEKRREFTKINKTLNLPKKLSLRTKSERKTVKFFKISDLRVEELLKSEELNGSVGKTGFLQVYLHKYNL